MLSVNGTFCARVIMCMGRMHIIPIILLWNEGITGAVSFHRNLLKL